MKRAYVPVLFAACASSTAPPAPATPVDKPVVATGPTDAQRVAAEKARRDELAAAHRELEDEQSTALARTCDKPAPPREKPTPMRGSFTLSRRICERPEGGYALVGGPDLRPFRGRVPRAAKKGTWQFDVEAAAALALGPEVARGESVRVAGTWKTAAGQKCVAVVHYARLSVALDACGSRGSIACEATGNAAAHALELLHDRLAKARKGSGEACQQASLEAIAVSRGMPRWRQYMQLNTTKWKASPRYHVRADGVLDEDALFARAAQLGTEALARHAECGGAANPKTTATQEQAFHGCF